MSTNHLAMSDEEFLKQSPPEMGEATTDEPSKSDAETLIEQPPEVNKQEEPVVQEEQKQEVKEEEKTEAEKAAEAEGTDEDTPEDTNKTGDAEPKKEGEPDPTGSKDKPEVKPEPEKKPNTQADTGEIKTPDAEEAQAFFAKIMSPIKANGKPIQLKNADEVIALMQMGANYTRKMQEIAPHRKLIRMLESNELLDEDRISFLIDLDKTNPEAIKKLIKDSGIDPLEIDTNTDPAYQEGSHKVSDEEVKFSTVLEELNSSEIGKQTILEVDRTWDRTSKDAAWANPEILTIINDQREKGIYPIIVEELDRQKALGRIAPSVPFIKAYMTVGDQLYEAGAFDKINGKADVAAETKEDVPIKASDPVVVTTRAAVPKPVVENGDKVDAASPTRAAPGKEKQVTNFLAMSDEDFLKSEEFKNRV